MNGLVCGSKTLIRVKGSIFKCTVCHQIVEIDPRFYSKELQSDDECDS